MRCLKFATVKTKPEYWASVEKGERTIEVSADDMDGCQGMVFIDDATGNVLGAAEIKNRTKLIDWTPSLVSKIMSVDERDVLKLFRKNMNNPYPVYVAGFREWRTGNDPLYAFEIEPRDDGELIRSAIERKDNK